MQNRFRNQGEARPGAGQEDWREQIMSDQEIKQIIAEGDMKVLVEKAQMLGKRLAGLPTHQLRNVYGVIRRAANFWEVDRQKAYRELILLKPKLAYYTEKEKRLTPLKISLDKAITILLQDAQPDAGHFENFVNFSEAIVAYHSERKPESAGRTGGGRYG